MGETECRERQRGGGDRGPGEVEGRERQRAGRGRGAGEVARQCKPLAALTED